VFATKPVPASPDVLAPDGSEVRALLELSSGGLAQFSLAAGETSVAVHHRTVEEIWYVLSGAGKIWRRLGAQEEMADLKPGNCLTVPLGTRFQFKSLGPEALVVIAITMPPWPGQGEAVRSPGPWEATVVPGPGLAEPPGPGGHLG
jgi:mannose-6-phosphate isomerase-like protein (cupin superfamily)